MKPGGIQSAVGGLRRRRPTDLVSGSNCCDPYGLHLFRRRTDGSFSPRRHLKVDVPSGDRREPPRIGAARLSPTGTATAGRTCCSRPRRLRASMSGRAGQTTTNRCLCSASSYQDRRAMMTGNIAVADWDGDGPADVLLGQWHEPGVRPYLLVPQCRATRASHSTRRVGRSCRGPAVPHSIAASA